MPGRVLVLIALLGFGSAWGQAPQGANEPRRLSLAECIDLALNSNLDLQIEQVEASLVRFSLNIAYGPYDPVFSIGADHTYIDAPGDFSPQKFNQDYPYEMTTRSGALGLIGNVPIGLSYRFDSGVGTKSATTDFNSNPDDASNFLSGVRHTNNAFANAGVELRQHLLKDFWIDQDREVIRLRRKDVQISEQAVRFELMKIVLAVELGYYDLIAAREGIRAEEKTFELNEQLLTETQRRV